MKARVKAVGPRGDMEAHALIDTGATYTLVDRSVDDEIGVKHIGKEVRLTVADGHEVVGELAVIDRFFVEGEELPYAHAILIDFPEELRKRLSLMGLAEWCIVGLTTIELLNLTPNTKTGRLEKASGLFLTLGILPRTLRLTSLNKTSFNFSHLPYR